MRLSFPNLTRPKKSAKIISAALGLPLSSSQRAIARVSGYADWHDLELNHSRDSAFPLDQDIEHDQFIDRQARLTLALADEVCVPDGDAQYALASSRLTGDRSVLLSDQIDIRLRCWRLTVLPVVGRRERGAVGRIKSSGWRNEAIILRTFGSPTTAIDQKNVLAIADFEYVSPRRPLPMFLPLRLYLPYGYWTEHDGAKVLFARDYMPMWRIRDGAAPQRLEPWLWIKWRDQTWLWEDVETPWDSLALQRRLEELLVEFGVQTLPVWADALPLLIRNDDLRRFSAAIDPLKQLRTGRHVTAA